MLFSREKTVKRTVLFILITVLILASYAMQPEQKPMSQVDNDLAAQPEGLDFDEFLEVSFRELMLREDPEGVIFYGLAEEYGLEEVTLTNVSDAYLEETYQMYGTVLEMLREYNRDELSPDQQISYDVYEWYLNDKVQQGAFQYYTFPANFSENSVNYWTLAFFTDIHPFATRQDAEDYVTRLYLVGPKFEQLIESLQTREEMGVILPQSILGWTLSDIGTIAHIIPRRNPYYLDFAGKLDTLEDLSEDEKTTLLEAALTAVEESVDPAYDALDEYLQHLESVAPSEDGLWQFPGGAEYYAYTLRSHTTTNLAAEEIHALGLQELDRIHAEMRAIFDELGYPKDESIVELYQRVARDGGTVPGDKVVATYESIIEEAEQNLAGVIDIAPSRDVVVIGGPDGNYYMVGPLDGSRPPAFYVYVDGPAPYSIMPTLAYHEAVPGHHIQLALAQEMDLPTFRRYVYFNGYVEGWALYAERLAADLGWYEDDPYSDLGRLRYEARRAARLVVDTGIHAMGWSLDEAIEFMAENMGADSRYLNREVGRYIVYPAQATSYMVGMLEILELRQRAMDQLGDEFDMAEFHRVVLSCGSVPLEILERIVDDYIAETLSQ
jgi:uncharacterized protein (DUF885 family)